MAGISVFFSLVLTVSCQAPGFTGFKEAWSEVKVILWWGLLVLVLVLDDVLWVQSQWKVQERTKSSKRINQIFTWLLYISAICSAWVASSTFLSSLILINLRRIKQFSHRNYLIWCMFYSLYFCYNASNWFIPWESQADPLGRINNASGGSMNRADREIGTFHLPNLKRWRDY